MSAARPTVVARFREVVGVRGALLVGLLAFGSVWFSVSLLDRFLGTTYLTQSGLAIISGPPLTTVVAFAFYVASLAALVFSGLSPSLRRGLLRIETSPAEAPNRANDLMARLRGLLPLRRIEWVAVLGSNVGILGLRFALSPFPQGSDTPQYLHAANSILFRFDLDPLSQLHSVGIGRWATVLGITTLRVILLPVPGQPELLTVIVAPVLLGIFYSLSIFVFMHRLLGDRQLAVWGAFLAPISFLTIKLSYDLFAQFLGQALSILALTGFFMLLLQGKGRARTTATLYAVSLLAHMWTWAVFVVISSIVLGWALLADSKGRVAKLRIGLRVLGPSFLLIALLAIALSSVRSDALYPYSVGDARLFSLPEGWLWIGGWESAVVWSLGLVGLLLLVSRRSISAVRVPLLLWTATISATVFITGFRDSYRFLIMYPMPILVALGMRHLLTQLRRPPRRVGAVGRPALAVRVVPAVALVLVLAGSVIPWAYIPEWRYFPGDAAYSQLVEIRNRYGFGNQSVLVLIDHRNFEQGFLWASAVTGAQVYPGNLLSLLRDDPYPRDPHRWLSADLDGVSVILLPSTLYAPDSMESQLLSSGVPGVPQYRVGGPFNVSSFLASAKLPLANSFWENWTGGDTALEHTFSTANSQLTWSLRAQSPTVETRSTSYVRPLLNRSAETLYILVSGSLNGAEGAIEVEYRSGSVTRYMLDRILPNPLLVRIPLPAGEIAMQAKITLWVAGGRVSSEGWIQIGFLGLLSP